MTRISDSIYTAGLPGDAFVPREDTAVFWLGSAGFLINCRGTVILLDPVLRQDPERPGYCETGAKLKNPYAIDSRDVPRVDFVLYTHSDSDHMGVRTMEDLAGTGAPMCGPYPVFYKLMAHGIPFGQCRVLLYGQEAEFGPVRVEVIPADHPWQLENPQKNRVPFRIGECVGYIFNTPDGRILFPGDTRLMEFHLSIRDIDLLALDVSDSKYHLGPEGAAALANSLEEAAFIPMHYATYDEPLVSGHTDHLDEAIAPKIRCFEQRARILNIGEGVRLRSHKAEKIL